MSPERKQRVVVVLVRARNPNNIGAVARAMHDFGFSRLRVVNEYAIPFANARSAIDASAVLADAAEFSTLAEAVADCTLVVGTTAGGKRDAQHPVVTLAQGAATIGSELASPPADENRVALLFGSEKTGLSNEEMSFCHWLLTIPMEQREGRRHPSMNLGQAAATCLYELVRADAPAAAAPASSGAAAADLERLTMLLTAVLEQSGYRRRHPANCDPAQIRRLVRRMALDRSDAPVWMGMLRQILWKLTGRTGG